MRWITDAYLNNLGYLMPKSYEERQNFSPGSRNFQMPAVGSVWRTHNMQKDLKESSWNSQWSKRYGFKLLEFDEMLWSRKSHQCPDDYCYYQCHRVNKWSWHKQRTNLYIGNIANRKDIEENFSWFLVFSISFLIEL